MNSGFAYDCELRGVVRSALEREYFAGGSAVLTMRSEGLDIELSDFEAENGTLKGNYLQHLVEIVIGDAPTLLDVGFPCLFMSLGRILLQGSVSTNLLHPMRHQVELQTVAVGM